MAASAGGSTEPKPTRRTGSDGWVVRGAASGAMDLPGRSRNDQRRDEPPGDDATDRGGTEDEDRCCAQERIRRSFEGRRPPEQDGCGCCRDGPSDDAEDEICDKRIESMVLARAKTRCHSVEYRSRTGEKSSA
jgi:hypothetical protein